MSRSHDTEDYERQPLVHHPHPPHRSGSSNSYTFSSEDDTSVDDEHVSLLNNSSTSKTSSARAGADVKHQERKNIGSKSSLRTRHVEKPPSY